MLIGMAGCWRSMEEPPGSPIDLQSAKDRAVLMLLLLLSWSAGGSRNADLDSGTCSLHERCISQQGTRGALGPMREPRCVCVSQSGLYSEWREAPAGESART